MAAQKRRKSHALGSSDTGSVNERDLIVVLAIYVESDRNELLASARQTPSFVASVQTSYGIQHYSEAKC